MSSIYTLIRFEEGWRPKPYLCTEKYPSVGFGFRIGHKGADINLYQFSLPVRAGEVWLDTLLGNLEVDMRRLPLTKAAILATLEPVVATFVAWWIWGEAFSLGGWVGAGLIVAAVFALVTEKKEA